MQYVLYMSQTSAKKFNPADIDPHKPWCMLSISDPGADKIQLDPNVFSDILRLEFLDVTGGAGCVTDAQLNKIAEFVQLNFVDKGLNLAVHCFMGSSRSAAVAKCIDDHCVEPNMRKYYAHNELIYKSLKDKLPFSSMANLPVSVYSHPEQSGNLWQICWDCYGDGCEFCDDKGKVRKLIF